MTAEEQVLLRIRAEYLEMPGLRLTDRQARRFWGLDETTCARVLDRLVQIHFLVRTPDGQYAKASEMPAPIKPRMVKSGPQSVPRRRAG